MFPSDGGSIRVHGRDCHFRTPRDAREAGIETIHQTLALAENLDAPSNLFLGRELPTPGARSIPTAWSTRRGR